MNPRPLGYEPYDARRSRLTTSPIAALSWRDARYGVLPARRCLSCSALLPAVSFTNPFTRLSLAAASGRIALVRGSWRCLARIASREDGRTIVPGYIPDAGRRRSQRLRGATLEEAAWEVSVTTNRVDYQAQPPDRGAVSVEELARRQGVRPVESVEDMARPGIFESDEELEEFLAHVYAARRADLA